MRPRFLSGPVYVETASVVLPPQRVERSWDPSVVWQVQHAHGESRMDSSTKHEIWITAAGTMAAVPIAILGFAAVTGLIGI